MRGKGGDQVGGVTRLVYSQARVVGGLMYNVWYGAQKC